MSFQAQYQQAQNYLRNRDYRSALEILRSLLAQTHVIDYEYEDWLRSAAEAYEIMNEVIPAAYIYLYLNYFGKVLQVLPSSEEYTMEVARCFELQKSYSRAARLYLQKNKFVHAAVNHER